jgi:hypothetical protein
MRRIITLLIAAPVMAATASAADGQQSDGSTALALAGLVGIQSPDVTAADKALLLKYLNGQAHAPHKAGKVVTVKAASVSCRSSNVDITSHSCTLKFGAREKALSGRAAHELYATLIEAGVEPDGAAGSVFVSVNALNCEVNSDEVDASAGGGARCGFDAG